jgi:hypothetical protein
MRLGYTVKKGPKSYFEICTEAHPLKGHYCIKKIIFGIHRTDFNAGY